jgi:SAM-dependent methyltransferase
MGEGLSRELPGNTFELVASASGIILDVGPGEGSSIEHMDPTRVDIVYGVEPAVDLHPLLKAKAEKYLGEKYKVLAAGAEPNSLIPALSKAGVLENASEGIFDTIICIRTLCSVLKQKETIQGLYKLLKPGGRMIVCEHVKALWLEKDSRQKYGEGLMLSWFLQRILLLAGWNALMGGCELNRDTLTVLKEAGGPNGWKSVDVDVLGTDFSIPFAVGTLVKS